MSWKAKIHEAFDGLLKAANAVLIGLMAGLGGFSTQYYWVEMTLEFSIFVGVLLASATGFLLSIWVYKTIEAKEYE